MEKGILNGFFLRLNNKKISYAVLNPQKLNKKVPKLVLPELKNEAGYIRFNEYPKELLSKIDIILEKESLKSFLDITNNHGVYSYASSLTNLIFFMYDHKLGLIRINIYITKKKIDRKRKKDFFILNKNIKLPQKKSLWRVKSLFRGKLVCFISPEGGGKTALMSATYMMLQNYPLKVSTIHFGCLKESRTYRIFDLLRKILLVHYNNFMGKITLTDRYIYLTFSDKPFLARLFRLIAPKPSLVFIMDADYKTLKKRRGPLCPPKQVVDNIYSTFYKIKIAKKIDSTKPIIHNLSQVIPEILK